MADVHALEQLYARLERLTFEAQHRFTDIAMGAGGVNPLANDPTEGFYAEGNGLEDDRLESTEGREMEQLHERMDEMAHNRQHEQQHEQGMSL